MTIRNDATRQSLRPTDTRRLRMVVPRQGQLLLDADLDQAGRLTLDRIEQETVDTLGHPDRLCYPAGTNAFRISASGVNAQIEPGHGYVKGWMIENTQQCMLDTQPHPRKGEALAVPGVVVLKTLQRYVDPVEEPAFADKALGDAQAAGRSLTDWQVLPLKLMAPRACEDVMQDANWQAVAAPSTGSLGVRVTATGPGGDPCSLTPQGGYSRLENLLYRIEVHGGKPIAGLPDVDGPRFGLDGLQLKLSRRNASLLVGITAVTGTELTVTPPAHDPRHWFAPGQFAEIVSVHDDIDPRAALASKRFFRVANATDDKVALEATPAESAAFKAFAGAGWFLRLWDSLPNGKGLIEASAPQPSGNAAPVDIGDNLSVEPGGGKTATFRRGDCWTFSARADGTIDWPAAAAQETPHGPETRYVPLAVIGGTANALKPEDCRIPVATLTDRALFYRGGDGQSAFPPAAGGLVKLAAPLRLAVMRGETPVPGAKIEWSLPPGVPAGRIDGQQITVSQKQVSITDADGLVSVPWEIDAASRDATHQVQATLLPPGAKGQPILFTARFRTARTTGYFNDPKNPNPCPHLQGVDNVQDALEALCHSIGAAEPLPRVVDINWRNDFIYDIADFVTNGFVLRFSEPMADACAEARHSLEVKLQMERDFFDIQCPNLIEIVLPGSFKLTEKNQKMTWTADNMNIKCLRDLIDRGGYDWLGTGKKDTIRCSVTLKSAVWYGADKKTGTRFLNGSTMTLFGGAPLRHDFARDNGGQLLPGDSKTSTDFESWFYFL